MVKLSGMERERADEKRKITAEKAWKVLKDEGLDVTVEQAGKVLEFLRKLGNIAVSNYLKKKKGKGK
jgi:hypothetical protein